MILILDLAQADGLSIEQHSSNDEQVSVVHEMQESSQPRFELDVGVAPTGVSHLILLRPPGVQDTTSSCVFFRPLQ